MNKPENGFEKDMAAALFLEKERHFRERIASLQEDDFEELGPWEIDINKKIGVVMCKRYGIVDGVLNPEGKKVNLVTVTFGLSSLKKTEFSPEAALEIQERMKAFTASAKNKAKVLYATKPDAEKRPLEQVGLMPPLAWMKKDLDEKMKEMNDLKDKNE